MHPINDLSLYRGLVEGVFWPRQQPVSKPADRSGRVAAKAAPTGAVRPIHDLSLGRDSVGGVFWPRQQPVSKS